MNCQLVFATQLVGIGKQNYIMLYFIVYFGFRIDSRSIERLSYSFQILNLDL